jgi:hypothetical protein
LARAMQKCQPQSRQIPQFSIPASSWGSRECRQSQKKINLEDCIKRSNKELSEIKEIEGKKHRVFNFPTDTSIGYIAPNKAVERKIRARTGSSKRLDQPAVGKITWPDDQPVSFTGGMKITNFPEIYEHFDNEAIASLTLKGVNQLPAIETLAKWPNLRWLSLQGCVLDAKYTKGLDRLQHLQSLTLNQTKFDLDNIEQLSLLPKLRSRQLDQIEGHSKILQALANSISLRKLSVSPDNPSDPVLGRFRKRFPNIKIVRLELKTL